MAKIKVSTVSQQMLTSSLVLKLDTRLWLNYI